MAFLKLAVEKFEFDEKTDNVRELYEKVKGEYSCLLESGGGYEEGVDGSRYSYFVYDPFLVAWAKAGIDQMIRRRDFCGFLKSGAGQIVEGEPGRMITDLLEKFVYKGKGPVPFCGGAVGYFGYDFGCGMMDVSQKVYDYLNIPDFWFGFYDKVVAIDHKEKVIYLMGVSDTEMSAERTVEQIKKDLSGPAPLRRKGEAGEMKSNLSKDVYVEKVAEIKGLLKEGEAYQVNFSQRFSAECNMDGFGVYRRLAEINPAPFACYFDHPDFKIVSCSPVLLLRKRGSVVESWPIKGTVRRGGENDDDEAFKELLASEKDEAELSMIVDLVRNDLGKVSEPGSVEVVGHRELLKCSHVLHTFSRVRGKLRVGADIYDCIKALFPGGSITGCPKKRSMEIIDRFEDFKRGVYTGSAGFISFNGESDFNILIRTMILKDGMVYFNSGGGIVIDSSPESEYQEVYDKAEALLKTVAKSESGYRFGG